MGSKFKGDKNSYILYIDTICIVTIAAHWKIALKK